MARKLTPQTHSSMSKRHVDEKAFLWALCYDEMACEKLNDGIRGFTKDTIKLEELIAKTYRLERSTQYDM